MRMIVEWVWLGLAALCWTLVASDEPDFKQKAIARLSQVFDIDRLPHRLNHHSPPQYMVDLYNSVAYSDGITKNRGPYGSDVVRGLPDRASTEQMFFYFNVSYVNQKEKILEAELHLFKLRPRSHGYSDPLQHHTQHLVEVKLYEVLDEKNMWSPNGLKLLEVRRVSPYGHGWQVFKVRDLVQQWINYPEQNRGVMLTAVSPSGREMNGTYVRFAQRSEHHDSKQPVLVVFTEKHAQSMLTHQLQQDPSPTEFQDETEEEEEEAEEEEDYETDNIMARTRQNYIKFMNEGYRNNYRSNPFNVTFIKSDVLKRTGRSTEPRFVKSSQQRRRTRRSKRTVDYSYHYPRKRKTACAKHELYVDFDEIGWSGWIISPKGYNAYHCKGECPFPLGQNQKPTNHATVQSIVHALRIGKDVGTPCCVPNKLFSISLLYFDDDENVILKQYDDMVAASCGCH